MTVSPVDVERFQQRLRPLLRAAVRHAREKGGLVPELPVGALTFGILPTPKWGTRITVDGDAVDVLSYQTVALIGHAGLDRIKACDCERLFVKTGRREFCSDRCQKRIYMRRLRQQERNHLTRSRTSHGHATRKK